MSIYLAIVILFSSLYILLIGWSVVQWLRSPEEEIVELEQYPSITVLIPFRNEEKNLPYLFKSLKRLNYPVDAYEFILINDHSEDESLKHIERVKNLRVMHMRHGETGKKMALEKGIAGARYDIIVTTDADCRLPEDWLLSIVGAHYENGVKFTTGPVNFIGDSAFQKIQAIENAGMMLMTHAGYKSNFFHLANGANLSVKWELFYAAQGYRGNRHRASGDDVLLAQKLRKNYRLHFRKSRVGMVETPGVKSWKEFWQQRVRWAAKSDLYTEFSLKVVQSFVAVFYIMAVVSIALIPFGFLKYCLWFLLIKLIGDFSLFITSRKFFDFPWTYLIYVPMTSVLHLFYLPIIGVYSLFVKRYKWKGRRTR